MNSLYILLGIFVIIFLYVLWCRRKFYILATKIPTQLGWPIVGVGPDFAHRTKVITSFERYRNTIGPTYVLFLGPQPFFMPGEPEICEKLLTSNKCLNKAIIYTPLDDIIGPGLISIANPGWTRHRKLINPSFNHKILLSFFPIFNQETNTLMHILSQYKPTEQIEMFDILLKMTFSVAIQTTMGQQLDIQLGQNSRIINTFRTAIKISTKRIFVPWLRPSSLFRLSSMYGSSLKLQGELFEFGAALLKTKKDSDNNEETFNKPVKDDVVDDINITKEKNIFLDIFYSLMKKNHVSKEEVVTESITMVAAAFETTANTIYITLICLSMFPEYQEKLFDDLYDLFPEKNFECTYDDLQNVPFLDIIINEAMRVLSPVPLVARSVSEDLDIGNGVILPKGTQIGFDLFNMHRDEKIWGPKAKTFYPEHFSKENWEKMHPYSFIPFSKGMRNCVGWRYALLSVKVTLAKLIRNYKFSTSFKFEDLVFIEDVILNFEKNPLLSVKPREK